MDERPVVLGLAGTHAGVEGRLGVGGKAGQSGGGRHRGLEGPAVRPLDALTFSCVAGVRAPAAARLVQTLTAGSVAGAVFSCSTGTKRMSRSREGSTTRPREHFHMPSTGVSPFNKPKRFSSASCKHKAPAGEFSN